MTKIVVQFSKVIDSEKRKKEKEREREKDSENEVEKRENKIGS